MLEAVIEVMEYCYKELNCEFLQCRHAFEKEQSKRVIEKAGFQYVQECEGTGRDGIKRKSKVYINKQSDKNCNWQEAIARLQKQQGNGSRLSFSKRTLESRICK